MADTTNIQYLQRNLLDDGSASIWGTAELQDNMAVETLPFSAVLARIGGTASAFESGRPFWVGVGTNLWEAPQLDVLLNGTTLGTAEYSVDYLLGRVTLATASTVTSDEVTATFYACNLWSVAQTCLVRRMNSTTLTGQQSSIRLGPLAKSVSSPTEMVTSVQGRINVFAEFAAKWREQGSHKTRVRM